MAKTERKEAGWQTLIRNSQEIYKNEKYKDAPSLEGIVDPVKQDLSSLLSIRVNNSNLDNPSKEFFIDTKKFKYQITTQQWLDFVLGQFNKKTGENIIYSPYSNPAYNFIAALIIGHHHFFKSAPHINFKDCNIDVWNNENHKREIPFWDSLHGIMWENSLSSYLFYGNDYKVDEKWVYRFRPEDDDMWKDNGLAFSDSEMILTLTHYYPWSEKKIGPLEIHIDKNLLPLFIQAYRDVNMRVSWPLVNLNVKKIQQALSVFLQQSVEERSAEDSYEILAREFYNNITP